MTENILPTTVIVTWEDGKKTEETVLGDGVFSDGNEFYKLDPARNHNYWVYKTMCEPIHYMEAPAANEPKFKIGDKVYKPKGYKFPSIIVSIFETTTGQRRVVAEMEGYGLLHIFNEDQLELRDGR